MPNLIPPKIPDGEKVDFDVSEAQVHLYVHISNICQAQRERAGPLFAGHPPEEDGEGPDGTADFDRGSL